MEDDSSDLNKKDNDEKYVAKAQEDDRSHDKGSENQP